VVLALLPADIYTVKKEDLDFQSNFQLEIIKDDYLHAIVGFFNCEFSKTHTKLWSVQHKQPQPQATDPRCHACPTLPFPALPSLPFELS
jgi:hypothetical protein